MLFLIRIKWKRKNTLLSEQFQTSNRKIVERDKIYTPSNQIHDGSLAWLGTGTLIKKKKPGRAKVVLWVQTINKYVDI
jgi:hypothetical protein